MSIKPTDILQALTHLEQATGRTKAGDLPKNEFADVLATATGGSATEARTMAALCRLEMMRGSIVFDNEQELDQSFPLPLSSLSAYRASSQRYDLPAATPAAEKPAAPPSDPSSTSGSVTEIAHRAAQRYGVDPALVKAVIKAESDFDPSVESKAGAQGLMQLMPGTARDLGVSDPFNPEQNVMAGTRYLRQLLDKYDGDLDKTLAAYNWGPGNVDRKGIDTLPDETHTYLARVKRFQGEFLA